MNLSLLILIPLLTSIAILLGKHLKHVKWICFIGATVQLVLSFFLLYKYWDERSIGNISAFLFEKNYAWFAPLNINFHTGVDGISIAMILLTAFVVLAGILVSWREEQMSKEFFFLLTFLSLEATIIPFYYFNSSNSYRLFIHLHGNSSKQFSICQ